MLATQQAPEGFSDFEDTVLPHQDSLFARAMRLERAPSEARDLVQDTLERALRHFDQFQPGTHARVWLFTIMFNLFIDRCRRRSREADLSPLDAYDLVAEEPDPLRPWETITSAEIKDAIAHLPDPFRVVCEMHWLARCSYKDISDTLRIPTATVGTRLLRARRKLRRVLEARLMPDDRRVARA